MDGQIHLIKCRCILRQFMNNEDPPNHEFYVFSYIDDDDCVKTKFVQCPNCGIVHKVYDICKSEIVDKENLTSVVTKNDIRVSLDEKLVSILEEYDLDTTKWEYAKFVLDNEKWGSFIVLTSEKDKNTGICQGKYLQILKKGVYTIEQFVREEVVSI